MGGGTAGWQGSTVRSLANTLTSLAKQVAALKNEALISFLGMTVVYAAPIDAKWMLAGAAAPVCLYRAGSWLTNRSRNRADDRIKDIMMLADNEARLAKKGLPPTSNDALRDELYRSQFGRTRGEILASALQPLPLPSASKSVVPFLKRR